MVFLPQTSDGGLAGAGCYPFRIVNKQVLLSPWPKSTSSSPSLFLWFKGWSFWTDSFLAECAPSPAAPGGMEGEETDFDALEQGSVAQAKASTCLVLHSL